MNLRQEIINAKDTRTVEHEVPEWKTTVYLRSFSGGERQRVLNKYTECEAQKKYYDVLAFMVLLGVGDENGNRVFSDNDLDKVLAKDAIVIERLGSVLAQHNGLHKEAVDEAKKD